MLSRAVVGDNKTSVDIERRAPTGTRCARLVFELLIGPLAFAFSATTAEARPLSLEERVDAQRAIEQVYWNHRIWPKENPVPKPPLSAVLPETALRSRMEDALRKSNALEKYWQRPITAEQLQAEMNRMAAHTRDPQVLRELFAALGNDPFLIAEILARQTLADRMIRNWYANDERFHGERRREAEAARARCRSVGCMPAMGGEYRETTWKLESAGAETLAGALRPDVVSLDAKEWRSHLNGLVAKHGGAPESLPILKLGGVEEAENAFVVTAVLSQGQDELRTATVTWRKVPFDAFWAAQRGNLAAQIEGSAYIFTLPATPFSGCVADTWTPIREHLPAERSGGTAVWTGTEMILWGGYHLGDVGGEYLDTGGRYNPSTDTWTPTSTGANVPSGRFEHTAVWTGTQMIVWGGLHGGIGHTNTGGRYDPSTDTWTPTSTGTNVPSARSMHTAVWTGSEMIVWGGRGHDSGGRYNPSTDAWVPTSTGLNVPPGLHSHTAVWTGTEMVIWGSRENPLGGLTSGGGRYDPVTDTWAPTSAGANTPEARTGHTAVWTGGEMIVWGGRSESGHLNTGGRYNPLTDAWAPTSTAANVPGGREGHTAVWTGTEMIVWGGYYGDYNDLNTGGRYDPSADTWTPTSTEANVPSGRYGHTAVWTGTEMIVWGGYAVFHLNTGGRYDPSANTWVPTGSSGDVPAARTFYTAVWTGTEMIVWGGSGIGAGNTGGRYDPSTDMWTPTSIGADVPLERYGHTAVWTGTEMIVWGGSYGTYLNTGGRYDPSADTWTPTSIGANVPSGRYGPTAVWTGTEMIVWGGWDGTVLNTGGRYDPSADTWTPTSIGANVPSGRYGHTAVWTGTEMIILGGADAVDGGGRYDPSADTWSPPPPGWPFLSPDQSVVWTGTEMIIWGGGSSNTYCYCFDPECDTGFCEEPVLEGAFAGRYNPSTDTWTWISSLEGLPRTGHTAVWTGAEMIVMGGGIPTCTFSFGGPSPNCSTPLTGSGGRYNPSTDTWVSTSGGFARHGHTTLWTGTQMIVWGGFDKDGALNTGGIYCACPNGTLYYRDRDGDGYGDAAVVGTSCDGTIPAGHVANRTDCNDTSASVNPGVAELCNAVDDDCDGSVDNAAPPGAEISVSMRGDMPSVEWTGLPTAQIYDVVFGDPGLLRSSGGDFTTATQGCVAAGTVSTAADFISLPEAGQAFWILVRGDNCAGVGTYDSGGLGQVGSRDAEINASPLSCGYQAVCGDGSCSDTEDCTTCPADCGSCQCATDAECQPASCCNPTSCISIWEPQSCTSPTCDDGCWYCLSACVCQNGACVAVF